LDIFTDEYSNRPLLNNIDLDPDDNLFINRPIDLGYLTLSQASSKLAVDNYFFLLCTSIVEVSPKN